MTDHAVGHHVRRSLRPLVQGWFRPWTHWHPTLVLRRVSDNWARHTLSTRYLIASIFVICTAMLHIGAWVDGRIRKSVVDPAASASAHYMERVIRTYEKELAAQTPLSEASKSALGSYVDPTSRHGILEIKIFLPDGTIIYSSRGEKSGKTKQSAELTTALSGRVVAHFDDAHDFEPLDDKTGGVPVFEVYAPLHDEANNRVIAVAQFFQDASILRREFTIARQHSWLVVGLLTLGMLSLLFGIVHRGSTLIYDQQQALQAKVSEQARLLKQNELLRARLTHAHQSSHMVSDKLMRRVGADLHDGPAQLLSLALLRLDELAPGTPTSPPQQGPPTLDAIRSVTQDALAEIRTISSGLSLPHLEHLSAAATIDYAIANHERWTRTSVNRDIEPMPDAVGLSARTCLFRCLQEGLNNAFHHADARGQHVLAHAEKNFIHLVVSDEGPGFQAETLRDRDDALGLAGLRHRLESIGGSIEILSVLGQGTKVAMTIPVKAIHD